MPAVSLPCFKAYDIRGELNTQLDESVAYRIGYAFACELGARRVVVGADIRLTSLPLKLALSAGLIDGGASVIDIGTTGTEEVYFAVPFLSADGGIEVTASHNPVNYNGMKLVKAGAVPISGDTGLHDIQQAAEQLSGEYVATRLAHYTNGLAVDPDAFYCGTAHVSQARLAADGNYTHQDVLGDYAAHMLSYINPSHFRPLTVVANAGNGAAGKALDAIEAKLIAAGVPITFSKLHHTPDGTFPNGIPNPLLPENRADTAQAVVAHNADFGIAWDGDFDRCFLFDEHGSFIEGYYIVGLLAEAFLQKEPGARIVFDPRLYWNTQTVIRAGKGVPVKSKTGHAFIKERMRKEDAIYGGEMSAHHYFRDFAYCDSGMIPWLLIAELLCKSQQSLGSLVKACIAAFPSSGEINRLVTNADAAIARVLSHFEASAVCSDHTDGISLEFDNWRFNLRKSNTEPVIRLNVESRGDIELMKIKTLELVELIESEH